MLNSVYMKRSWLKPFFITLVAATIIGLALFVTNYISDHPETQEFIASLGYPGVVILAIIAGLNLAVPIHAATFVPLFLTAGLAMPLIVVALVIGTTIADLIGYLIGRFGRRHLVNKYQKIAAWSKKIHDEKRHLVVPFVFLYSSFVPFPNEAMLIPLALLGVRIRLIIIPLILGTFVHQATWAYGFSTLFELLFG